MKFLEVEHKFLVNPSYTARYFSQLMKKFRPLSIKHHEVDDHYFLLKSSPQFIYRYRCDDVLEQLTVKSYGADNETRLEVNLNLCHQSPNQLDAVEAFFETLGRHQHFMIHKSVDVYDFDDAEVVFYIACNDQKKEIRCIEIEAKNCSDQIAALSVLRRYEERLELDPKKRCRQNLFDLMFGRP